MKYIKYFEDLSSDTYKNAGARLSKLGYEDRAMKLWDHDIIMWLKEQNLIEEFNSYIENLFDNLYQYDDTWGEYKDSIIFVNKEDDTHSEYKLIHPVWAVYNKSWKILYVNYSYIWKQMEDVFNLDNDQITTILLKEFKKRTDLEISELYNRVMIPPLMRGI